MHFSAAKFTFSSAYLHKLNTKNVNIKYCSKRFIPKRTEGQMFDPKWKFSPSPIEDLSLMTRYISSSLTLLLTIIIVTTNLMTPRYDVSLNSILNQNSMTHMIVIWNVVTPKGLYHLLSGNLGCLSRDKVRSNYNNSYYIFWIDLKSSHSKIVLKHFLQQNITLVE